jgi:trans-aconitate 2-methyltransferase
MASAGKYVMSAGYPFDGKKYEQASQCQQEWGIELVEELSLRGDERILDLGCGTGEVTRALAERVPQGFVLGIDNSRSMLEVASAHRRSNMAFELLDITDLPFEAEFDVIFSNATLHWILDHEQLLKKLHRALKPGGFMRIQFGGAGNIATLIEVLQRAMGEPAYARWFERFKWPWYMPELEEYERLLARSDFKHYRIWGEQKDRYFPDKESFMRMIDEPGLVPFLVPLPEALKQSFRDAVLEAVLERTKQRGGRHFERFRRINVYAEK